MMVLYYAQLPSNLIGNISSSLGVILIPDLSNSILILILILHTYAEISFTTF